MNACPTCGKQHEPTIRFCPDDGTPLSETAVYSATYTPTSQQPGVKIELTLPVVVGERYKLTEVRGGGGMAKVYRAVDQTLERAVAVKIINAELRNDPEFDARFQREARIASQLSDPHIVVVHDFDIDPTYGPFLVMEFLEGVTLRERMQTQGCVPVNAATQVWEQLLLALIHAHGKGIVHRDIKPDNLFLLSQSGVRMQLRVLDFGIARMLKRGEPGNSLTLTSPGAVLGTPRYMSPEQLAGQAVDARSDLYSSALVIHEALTGDLPYATSRKLSETCVQASLPLQQLVEHCLKPTPDERPKSAEEIYERLQRVKGGGSDTEVLSEKKTPLPKGLLSQDETETYVTSKPVKSPRRKITIALFAGLLAVTGPGVFGVIKGCSKSDQFSTPEQESLLGVKIGQTRDELIAAIGAAPQREQPHGNPWKDSHKKALGNVLKPKDLSNDEDELDELDMALWPNGEICALLQDNVVRALVVRNSSQAASGRGIRIGASAQDLETHYPLDSNTPILIFDLDRDDRLTVFPFSLLKNSSGSKDKASKKPTSGKVYRYNNLGIGFEVVNEKVTAITLYPAQAQTEVSP